MRKTCSAPSVDMTRFYRRHCRRRIGQGRYVTVNERPYHPECWEKIAPRCAHCGKILDGKVYRHDDDEYHEACWPAVAPKCGLCGKAILGSSVAMELLPEACFHRDCFDKASRCSACGLPASKSFRGGVYRLRDGRTFCGTCGAAAVTGSRSATEALAEARVFVEGSLHLDLRKHPVSVTLVDKPKLSALYPTNSKGHSAFVQSETKTTRRTSGRRTVSESTSYTFRIFALSSMPRRLLEGILVHELVHVWQVLNCGHRPDQMEKAWREGSANYASFRYLAAKRFNFWRRHLELQDDPHYGKGFQRFRRLVEKRGERHAFDLLRERKSFPWRF